MNSMKFYRVVFNYQSKGSVSVDVVAPTSKRAIEGALSSVGDEPFISITVEERKPPAPKKHEDNIVHLYHE